LIPAGTWPLKVAMPVRGIGSTVLFRGDVGAFFGDGATHQED